MSLGESGGSGGARFLLFGSELMRSHRKALIAMMSIVGEVRLAAGEEGALIDGLDWLILCLKSLVAEVAAFFTIFLASQLVQVSGEFTPAIFGCLNCPNLDCLLAVTVVGITNNSRNAALKLILWYLNFSVLFQAEANFCL